jgi:pSer/pThr/pTyr-binding forkhead associated (FHA) protein
MKRTNAESQDIRFRIGRVIGNDMIMKDMAISKRHAIIQIHKGSFYIKDCGSTNGTRLNGQTVKDQPVKLNDKDTIQLGNYEFTFLSPASLHDLLSNA